LMRFEEYPGLFVYHCHNLEHEDGGMMRNYLIRA
jgi:FtsP/CotA-like multicopper oxidase with cupredoxin domain